MNASQNAVIPHEDAPLLRALDESVAIALGRTILDIAVAESLVITVEVHVRGRLIFRAALPGTSATNDRYLGGKLRWVQDKGRSSLFDSLVYAAEHPDHPHGVRSPEVGPFGGGVALRTADDELAGVALVSGLAEADDHALVLRALRQLMPPAAA